MLKNYLKVAFRNLLKRKVFTSINIFGLAIGVACSALILLWIEDEINYDSVFPKQDQIYYVPTNQTFDGEIYTFYSTPGPLAKDLKDEIPEITHSATTFSGDILLNEGDNGINRTGRYVDPDFLEIFSLQFLEGNPENALNRPDAIVLTQRTANSLFGESTRALNRVLQINGKYNFTVTGVVKDLPQNVQDLIKHMSYTQAIPLQSQRNDRKARKNALRCQRTGRNITRTLNPHVHKKRPRSSQLQGQFVPSLIDK